MDKEQTPKRSVLHMSHIKLCVPVTQPHKFHTPQLMQWYKEQVGKDFEVSLHWEFGRPLQKVQSNAVELAREDGCSHVLFTEHDQWGYPHNGLDVLLDVDKDVVGFPTYQRAYPYLPMCMMKIDPEISFLKREKNLRSFQPFELMVPTDLITWAFTLVKMSVFDRMDEADMFPWVWDATPTDSHFCQCCEDLGIERWIHSGAWINHGELAREQIPFYKRMYDAMYAHQGKFHPDALPQEIEDDLHGMEDYRRPIENVLADSNVEDTEAQIKRLEDERVSRVDEYTPV